ncbi:1-deoxy-D-xylulose-5-phosphate reductoisomerase [Patulibacter defluvii]|uniref:1-deoxy-D-xylulose-5-phosphate reductoisomerase n=1 Tax=Patulibacter defluvii TaxID=3095358 RepID=UPI002A74B796|nr:1-deoxy-D-xylulose-5-phosphate reductoisomerase [Patulibacter sp. DM4]
MARRILILGSTGSIGVQALDVVAQAPAGTFEVVGLAAARQWEPVLAQARAHGVPRIALADPDAAARAAEAWTDGQVLQGPEGLVQLVLESGADLVLNALVGAAGLGPTVATLGEGIDLALANKESLVVGGELVMQLAEATGARVLPVDSEHSALWQLVHGETGAERTDGTGSGGDLRLGTIDKLVLTASGGPFRGRRRDELAEVGIEQALAHPTWAMGGKITIDSATLMNKGLEVIEAHHLFGTPYERIDVVVHPQSIVHSYVTLVDGAALAHLGHPDMRAPIAFALHHPERVPLGLRPLDLAEVGTLSFERPDEDAFPCLRLAREAGIAGGTAPCVLNAANEVAVHAFLAGRIGFLDIAAIVEQALETVDVGPVRAFETLYAADRAARDAASALADERG